MEKNDLVNILNKYRENRMAHAYLIETNDQDTCIKELLTIIREILCEKEYKENCSDCNLCNLIKLNNLPTLKIIEPDGSIIKKSQIQELKDTFCTKPIYSKYNIYIIKNAEKLNASSANTMLKFLEEPDGQVLGFFVTNNKDNIILTIQSRCQLLKAKYDITENNNLELLESEDLINDIRKYIFAIESSENTAILNNKKIVLTNILNQISMGEFLSVVLDIYVQALYFKQNIENQFVNYKDFNFVLELDEQVLIKKINLIVEFIENMNYNLNSELLLDRFVIEMSGIND